MALKRSSELTDFDDEGDIFITRYLPPKRRQYSFPRTPFPAPRPQLFSAPGTPFTPLPTRPHDSPSNPFSRKRAHILTHTLPPITTFGKHLPLRFQLIRSSLSPRLGGTYRVVQVPLNYTFVHLRFLISFLFGGGWHANPKEDRHLFEVKKRIVIYSMAYKPGQIKSGATCVKLSDVRDPCRYRPEVDEDEDAFTGEDDKPWEQNSGDDKGGEEDDEECEDWIWQAEEDFTLNHVWPKGGDLSRGIIYHHNNSTAIHITLNATTIPKRRGRSNTPYVFSARGRVQLFPRLPPPLPKPIFSVPTDKLKTPDWRLKTSSAKSPAKRPAPADDADVDAEGEYDPDYGDASSSIFFLGDDDDEKEDQDPEHDTDPEFESDEEEDPSLLLDAKMFNSDHAFEMFIKRLHSRLRHIGAPVSCLEPEDDFSEDEGDDENVPLPSSTPGLDYSHASSSPVSSPVKSPAAAVCLRYPLESLSKMKYAYTPAPPVAPWKRRRIERVEKRLERMKKGDWICSADEDKEKDEDDEDEINASTDEKNAGKSDGSADDGDDVFVRPKLAPGEVWDPFGEESEV